MKIKSVFIRLIILLCIIGGGYYAWQKYMPTEKPSAVKSQAEQAKDLVENVSKLIVIPNETPVIATINDAATLIKEQPFYTGAQNGDVVFIFQAAAKAIVYSPSRNIIINVGPVLPQQDVQPQATTTATTTKKTTTKK